MSDILRAQLQSTLGDAYTLERELGGGGMSRVFVARETALSREVVVKVLAPELAASVSVERFAPEIATAARLQQANIVPVLTAGASGGMPYYTMPFVKGESLRALLSSGMPLSMADRIGVLRDVARALAYAHAEGGRLRVTLRRASFRGQEWHVATDRRAHRGDAVFARGAKRRDPARRRRVGDAVSGQEPRTTPGARQRASGPPLQQRNAPS